MRLFATPEETITQTFYTSQTWVCPLDVIKINRAEGMGARGQAEIPGYYDPNVNKRIYITHVSAFDAAGPTNAVTPGSLRWEDVQGSMYVALNKVNSGGTGTMLRYDFFDYTNGWASQQWSESYTNAVPGTGSLDFSAGWKTTGFIAYPDFAYAYLNWQERGTYHPPIPATTGASATGFGRTFPGSTGDVQPTITAYTDIPVTPGTGYALSIPAGGFITITYIK